MVKKVLGSQREVTYNMKGYNSVNNVTKLWHTKKYITNIMVINCFYMIKLYILLKTIDHNNKFNIKQILELHSNNVKENMKKSNCNNWYLKILKHLI